MSKLLNYLFETAKMVVLALVIVLPIRYFLFQPFVVSGSSMAPNLHDGDYLLIDEISYRVREPKRGEIVVFRAPPNPSARYIKRIIGLPGETVELREGEIIISDKEGKRMLGEPYIPNGVKMENQKMTLKEEEYFVLGDNRSFSSDSRSWGPLAERNIVGRAFFRVLPVSSAETIERPAYTFKEGMLLTNKFCLLGDG